MTVNVRGVALCQQLSGANRVERPSIDRSMPAIAIFLRASFTDQRLPTVPVRPVSEFVDGTG